MSGRGTVWFDFDNAPQVRYLLPIARELRRRGHATVATARDVAETVALLEREEEPFTLVGKVHGLSLRAKAAGTLKRTLRVARLMRRHRPAFSVSNSRSCALASRLLGIPAFVMVDYEGVDLRLFSAAGATLLMPSVVDADQVMARGVSPRNLYLFPGLKEDITFAAETVESLDRRAALPFETSFAVVTVRPPSPYAHYRAQRSFELYLEMMARLAGEEAVQTLILPRLRDAMLEQTLALPWRVPPVVPDEALDGTAVVWRSDAVLSGGGTMTREAAVLGVPAYSVFAGKMGAVDAMLVRQGRLTMVRDRRDIAAMRFGRRQGANPRPNPDTLAHVCAVIESVSDRRVRSAAVERRA
ncbi:MAG: DUF354 domain-containing protein [Dehalococcoidia bacterium]